MRQLSIFGLLFLILLPNLYLYSKGLDLGFNNSLLNIIFIIYLYALVKDSRYLIVLYPIIVIVPFIIFYIYLYNTSVNEQILTIVLETNWQEALSFLGSNTYLYVGIVFIWIMFVTLLYWQNYQHPLRWTHRSRGWVVISISITTIITFAANQILIANKKNNSANSPNNFLIEDKNSSIEKFKQTYPLGLFVSLYDVYQQQAKMNTAVAKNQKFSFNAKASDTIKNKQLIVLVIGETSRRANWQLNGYSRNTNPLLASRTSVVNFSDMLSISNFTRTSIPMLLTRKPSERVNSYNFPEKSVISAFKEAGFDTYWLSTQQKFGRHDTSTSVYAKEADNLIFLNKTSYSNQGETDEVVLPVFEQILKSPAKKIFIVIHTLGSHFDYSHRYPNAFDIFKPSLNDLDRYSPQDRQYKQQIVNSYDNSILYTDYVINELIDSMQTQTQTESFLLYSSDHGEDLFDAQCDKSGHANKTPYNFEIASLAWYSPRFATSHANKVQQLQANATKPINHTSIFPTLIDAADITIPDYSLSRSLLGSLNPYPRLVLGGIDYDNNEQQGSCREIQ